MKVLLKIFAILGLISIFFEGFIFFIGPVVLKPFKILVPVALILYAILNKDILQQIVTLYKKTPFKYLVWFIAWLFIDAFILLFMGRVKILIFYSLSIKLLPAVLEVFLLTALLIPKVISIKNFIKIFTIINYVIFIFAFIEYIGSVFHISIISHIIDAVSNLKQLAFEQGEMIDLISGSHRVRSIFHEPGALAGYIFFVMPVFYSMMLSKNRIFDNTLFNKVVKISFIPLMWFTLIMTKSPIFLVFSLISTAFYFLKDIIRFMKKHIVVFVLISILFVTLITSILLSNELRIFENTFLARITNVVSSMKSINEIIENEPSLGFRIVSFVNALRAYAHHPIIGYGFDNLRYYIEPYLLSSPVALTRENIYAMTLWYKAGTGVAINYTNLTRLLAETGIIGTLLFYFYVIRNILYIRKVKKYYTAITYDLCCGLEYFLYCSIFASVYVHTLGHIFVMLLYGIVCALGMSLLYFKNNTLGEKDETINISCDDNI